MCSRGPDKEFLSSKFSMKDMEEADVILGIRIKHESHRIAISQSLYIEKGDWLPDVCHDLYKPDFTFAVCKLSSSQKKKMINALLHDRALATVIFVGNPSVMVVSD
ncbi:hypothetical protein Tco_0508646, partial [Tanacetum coccineum]